jgi:drug/metabolite transporter (DMT)-like permease
MAQDLPPSWSHSSKVDRESDSIGGLLGRLAGELSTLFRKEIALAKAEVSESASHAKAGAIALVAGGAVLFAGMLVILAAAVLALSHVVDDWLAALIVGILVAAIGFVMMQSGKKQLEPSALKPERTQEALRKDKEMVQRRTA